MYEGNRGEIKIQSLQQSRERAKKFYKRQMRDSLSEKMVDLVGRQEMVFVATSDENGNCDCSPRFGTAGFVIVLDDRTLAYPEYRGNGVHASLGNILVFASISAALLSRLFCAKDKAVRFGHDLPPHSADNPSFPNCVRPRYSSFIFSKEDELARALAPSCPSGFCLRYRTSKEFMASDWPRSAIPSEPRKLT